MTIYAEFRYYAALQPSVIMSNYGKMHHYDERHNGRASFLHAALNHRTVFCVQNLGEVKWNLDVNVS